MRRRWVTVVSALYLTVMWVGGAGGIGVATAGSAEAIGTAANPVKIATARLGIYLAGYTMRDVLAKDGVHTELLEFPTTPSRFQALVNGHAHMAFVGWTDTIKLASEGVPLVVLTEVAGKGAGIIVRTDSGINSVADWRGKKIGVAKGTHQELIALWYLRQAHIPPSEVELVHMTFADMPIALARKNIDAFIGSEPFPAMAIVGGYGRLMKRHYEDMPWGDLNVNITSMREVVEKHPGTIRVVIRAFHAANVQLMANLAETKRAAVTQFKFPESAVDVAFNNITFRNEIQLKLVQGLIDAEYALQYIKKKPDLHALIDERFAAVAR